ncbi:hypothetical protein RCO28_30290 [Streptomyces sp. LHD-70]|uniref:hypothetical protein n=1 Tax=Streptomyces sp. LHD-70 TaxID=3072140 RepID=UPI0028100B42|nr:hypothetical protein [Streptomyces sp. LHD-70]MDQ8706731.1 hypothetical protein [Streptomyces sp. LHD-70]
MHLSDDDFAYLRSELGEVNRQDLEARYARLHEVRDVALEVLRERRASLVADPLTVTVQGVATVNNAENVRALERQIAELGAAEAGAAESTVPLMLQRRQAR